MSAYTVFDSVVLTAAEQSAIAAVGMTGEDANGMLSGIKADLDEVAVNLARITANCPAGANLTAIQAYVTAALT